MILSDFFLLSAAELLPRQSNRIIHGARTPGNYEEVTGSLCGRCNLRWHGNGWQEGESAERET